MTTLYPPDIHQHLKNKFIFLDTNVFIFAAKNESFTDFLISLNKVGCSFSTIPSVVFELTNGSNSSDTYNKRIELVNSLVDRVDPVQFMNNISDFYIVMSKINSNNPSYTDFLLAACLYQYRNSNAILLTADLKALPSFFPREDVIAVEHGKEVKPFGFYSFDLEGYAKAAAKIS